MSSCASGWISSLTIREAAAAESAVWPVDSPPEMKGNTGVFSPHKIHVTCLSKELLTESPRASVQYLLGGHPKPAINGQLKTGHFE
jgi:hypothetical protein